jgi:hypothetical protein
MVCNAPTQLPQNQEKPAPPPPPPPPKKSIIAEDIACGNFVKFLKRNLRIN